MRRGAKDTFHPNRAEEKQRENGSDSALSAIRDFISSPHQIEMIQWNTKGKQTFALQINGKTNAVHWEKIKRNSFASIDCHSVRRAEKVNLSLR